MLLNTLRPLKLLLTVWAPLVLFGQVGQVQRASSCFLEMPVYDPFGNRLSFRVVRVAIKNGGVRTDLLGKTVDGITIRSAGDRVLFSSDRIVGKRPIEVTLEGPQSRRVTSEVYPTTCRQRRSLFYGQSDTGATVAFIQIKGRLSGCTIDRDWWVRATPMFGGHDGTTAEDGYVEADGTFSLEVAALGVRRILVIGRGRHPVKAVGVDVTVGRPTDVGLISLAGLCP